MCLLFVVLFSYYYSYPFRGLVLPLAISAMLASAVHARQSFIFCILETPLLRWIGRLSYSLYLWQQLFLVATPLPYPFPIDPHRHPYFPLLGALSLASASRYIIEKPMIEIGRRCLSRATRHKQDVPSETRVG
jgi:peptidoglycan/LPS O-acetylase OafA/YrhL